MLRQNKTVKNSTITVVDENLPDFELDFSGTATVTVCNTTDKDTSINIKYKQAGSSTGSSVFWYKSFLIPRQSTWDTVHLSANQGDMFYVYQDAVSGTAPSGIDITFMNMGETPDTNQPDPVMPIDGSLIPAQNSVYTLGKPSYYWHSMYTSGAWATTSFINKSVSTRSYSHSRPSLQVATTADFSYWSTSTAPFWLTFGKSKSASVGVFSKSLEGDNIGGIAFCDAIATTSTFFCGASIETQVDAAPTSNAHTPMSLIFRTSNGASPRASRWAIKSQGHFMPSADNAYSIGSPTLRASSIYSATGVTTTSDRRSKTNINDSILGLAFVNQLRAVSFNNIEGGNTVTGVADSEVTDSSGNRIKISQEALVTPVSGKRRHWGLIAQEVKTVIDALGVDFGGWLLENKDDPDSQQSLRYEQFIAPLIKAVQELSAKVDSQQAEIENLKKGN